MRKSLFEKIKEEKINYLEEILKIHDLVSDDYYLKKYLPEEFQLSNYRFAFSCYADALNFIVDFSSDSFCKSMEYYRSGQYNSKYNRWKIKLDVFLDYLEFYRTLCLNQVNELQYTAALKQLIDMLTFDANRIGYYLMFDKKDKVYKAMLINPEAEAVALNVKSSIRDKIYNYLMIRNGRVLEKRECIKSLADDVESICKKYSNVSEYDKLKQFIQCTRHTKDEPKKEFPFYYKNEEKWLDNTFNMIIGILAFTKTKEIVKEIKELENKEGK